MLYLTNRFQVAVRLFSYRSQMTSKCGKNKKVAHRCGRGCHWCSYHILMSSVIYYWTICFIIYRFSQALKWSLHFFFPRTSLMNNTLPRPGLEPRSSDLEPSALTTGLLNKAVALVCPQYSWPCIFKVAPCMVVWLYIQIFWLDGLLLFCIIMGLSSASFTIIKN